MEINNYIRSIKRSSKKIYEIKELKTIYGEKAYYGFKNGKQYTEDFYSKEELIEQYPEFKK